MQSQFDEIYESALAAERPGLPSRNVVLLGAAKLLERTSFYGLRSIIVIYLLQGEMGLEDDKTLSIYSIFTVAVALLAILGAIIGDLVIGNKRAMIAGSIIQAAGAFCLAFIPTINGVYLGLGAVAFGTGLITPNIIARFVKEYLHRTRFLDSSMTAFFLLINVGGLLGTLVIAGLNELAGYRIAFICAGVLMLINLVVVSFISHEGPIKTRKQASPPGSGLRFILLMVGLYFVYSFAEIIPLQQKSDIQLAVLTNQSSTIAPVLVHTLQAVLSFAFGILAALVWLYYSIHSFKKIGAGLILCGIGVASILFTSGVSFLSSEQILIVSGVLAGAAEILIVPIIFSEIGQKGNPKYLAITFSIIFAIPILLNSLYEMMSPDWVQKADSTLSISIILMALGAVVIFLLQKRAKK